MEIKYSELEKQEKIKHIEKKELELQLKQKEEELKNIQKNFPENYNYDFNLIVKQGNMI